MSARLTRDTDSLQRLHYLDTEAGARFELIVPQDQDKTWCQTLIWCLTLDREADLVGFATSQ